MGNAHGYAAIASLALLACQPMYGEKPDTLGKVKPIAKKTDGKDGEPAKKEDPYVTACSFNSHLDPKVYGKRDPKLAEPLRIAGDAKITVAQQSTVEKARVKQYQLGLDDYAAALKKDPYDADATLGLARAYDGLKRSGCAVMLIKRLADLTRSDKYADSARRAIAQVQSNPDWFKDYRQDVDRELP
ncbi:MAG: hypothetical protein KF773_11120 [Deltaproteobacteria bacterium]|nr:hypothetical protein [Deltaproteobacteria bacterium]